MKKLLIASCQIVLLITCCYAQNNDIKRTVGIMAFASSLPANADKASQLHEFVTEIISKKSNLTAVDRSKDSLVVNELYNQTREESLRAKALAEQGMLSGVQDIITGTVTSVSTQPKTSSGMGAIGHLNTSSTKYIGSISFALQAIDCATGTIISQKSFNQSTDKTKMMFGGMALSDTKEEAIISVMKASKSEIINWLNTVYPPDIKIIKIIEDKNSSPESVYVTGLDNTIKKGTQIVINESEQIDTGNKKIKNLVPVGKLKVLEIKEEFAICKVTEGEENLKSKWNDGANKLEFVVKQ